jgi:quercetin dioxygenase-like cupin family protein
MEAVITSEENVKWEPHPMVKEIKIKVLLSKRDHGVNITCMLVRLPKGSSFPEHIHKEQDDIVFYLSGKCRVMIDGVGELIAKKGTFLRIPKNTRHAVLEALEDTLLYDVFSPAMI